MRSIKFRAWDKYDRIFRDVVRIDHKREKVEVRHPEGNVDNVDGFIFAEGIKILQFDSLQQYTGLHDKNDKEIYEGDIIGWEYYADRELITGNSVVTFEDGCFKCNDQNRPDFIPRHVVGNIYENPELIT